MKTIYTLALSVISLFAFPAEYFLKINLPGKFTVALGGQYQENPKNVFRFFDIDAGFQKLKITNNGFLIVDNFISINNGDKIISEMNASGTITTIMQTSCNNNTNWYFEQSTYNNYSKPTSYNNGCSTPVSYNNNYNTSGSYNNYVMSDASFNQLKINAKQKAIDSNILAYLKSSTNKSWFSVAQISELCYLFTFDSYKLDFAKFAYDRCINQSEYFTIGNAFTYKSYERNLLEYINSKTGSTSNYIISDASFNQLKTSAKNKSIDSSILEYLKLSTTKSWFTVAQINELCSLFTFDSNRLDFAKFAYDRCVNKNEYFTIGKTFTFASNEQELLAYINSY